MSGTTCAIPTCRKQRWHNSRRCVKHIHLYECDVCGAKVPREQIASVIAYGIETGACDKCRGDT